MRLRFGRVRSLLVLIAALTTATCNDILGIGGDVEVRIRNASAHDFASLIVQFPEQTEDYGALPAGGVSEYRVVSRAYSYAGIEVTLNDNRKLTIPAGDFSGEVRLGAGKYTYQLGVTPSGQSLTTRMVIDEES